MTKLNLVFRWVEIGGIQPEDRTLATRSNSSPSADLLESVRRHGLLSPLTLGTGSDGRYRIVSGFRRFRVATDLGLSTVPARIAQGVDSLELFQAALAENLWSTPLSDLDKGLVVSKLHRQFGIDRETIIAHYLKPLGIKRDRFHFSRYLAVSRLPEELRDRLEAVSVATAVDLARWPAAERALFLRVLDLLSPTRSHRKELFQVLSDLRERSSREAGPSLEEIWESTGCAGLLRKPERVGGATIRKILALLSRVHRPELDRMTREYQRELESLEVPNGVDVSPPRFFEGDKIEIRFSVTGAADLETVAQRLLRMAGRPGLHKIFELL